MNKIALFAIIVFFGVIGILVLSNKDTVKPTTADINFQLTPTVAIPTLIPSQGDASGTPVPSTSQQSNQNQPNPSTVPNAKKAVIKTSKGDITIELYTEDAPKTVANFLTKAGTSYYNGLTFHRVEDWVVQGGDPKGDGTGGGNMPTELNKKSFLRGAVGVARGGDIKISNDSQFFFTKKDSTFLDGQYTNFGQVTDGMDVVDKIAIGDKILSITAE
jgi:peptidyl-prolyl cis-trans isomerase B (cyclophilin B)